MQVLNQANLVSRQSRIVAALVQQICSKRRILNVNCSSNKSLSFFVCRSKERSWNTKIMAGSHSSSGSKKTYAVKFPEEELRKRLTPEQFRVTQEKGTERPYTGEYTELSKPGFYHCVVCDATLFDHTTKFESHCGWPAFYASKPGTVDRHEDRSHGMERVETVCAQCGAHLGHVFTDGPKPTGERYCINSASLKFKPVQK